MDDNQIECTLAVLLTEIIQCWKENNLNDVKEKVLQFNTFREENEDSGVFRSGEFDFSPTFTRNLTLKTINETLDYILNNLNGFYNREQTIWRVQMIKFELQRQEMSSEEYREELVIFVNSFIENPQKLQKLKKFNQFYDLIQLCVVNDLYDELEELKLKMYSILEKNDSISD